MTNRARTKINNQAFLKNNNYLKKQTTRDGGGQRCCNKYITVKQTGRVNLSFPQICSRKLCLLALRRHKCAVSF